MGFPIERAVAAVERMIRTSDVLRRRFEELCREKPASSAIENLGTRLILAFRFLRDPALDDLLIDLASEEKQWMRDTFPYQIFEEVEYPSIEELMRGSRESGAFARAIRDHSGLMVSAICLKISEDHLLAMDYMGSLNNPPLVDTPCPDEPSSTAA